jgi:hypothetical protein
MLDNAVCVQNSDGRRRDTLAQTIDSPRFFEHMAQNPGCGGFEIAHGRSGDLRHEVIEVDPLRMKHLAEEELKL